MSPPQTTTSKVCEAKKDTNMMAKSIVPILIFMTLWVLILGERNYDLGSMVLPLGDKKTLNFLSKEYRTELVVEIDQSIKEPTISMKAKNIEIPSISNIVHISTDDISLTINLSSSERTSTAPRIANRIGLLVMFTSIFILFSAGVLSQQKGGFLATLYISVVIGIVITLLAEPTTSDTMIRINKLQANQQRSLQVHLRLPPKLSLDNVMIDMADGSVESSGQLSLEKLQVKLCEKGGSISLNQLSISSELLLCASQNIVLKSLHLATFNTKVDIKTEKDLSLSFESSFFGTYSVNGTEDTTITGSCVRSEDRSKMIRNCNDGQNKLNVVAGGKVVINFSDKCIEKISVDFESARGVIDPIIKGKTVEYNTVQDWSYTSSWSQQGSTIQSTPDPNTMQLTTGQWTLDTWWLINRKSLPPLSIETSQDHPGSFLYTIRFSYFPLPRSDFRSNVTNVTVAILNRYESYLTTEFIETNPHRVVASFNLEPPFFNYNASITKEVVFKTSVPISESFLALRFQTQAGANAIPMQFKFGNIQFIIPDRHIPVPPQLITNPSELVHTRKPSIALDENPRTNCPHTQKDVKLWHEASTWPDGKVPLPTQQISIPPNTKVLITECSINPVDVYNRIYVPETSELIFADAPITLNVRAIFVDGHLWIGSPTCRLFSHINIIFHGKKSDTSPIIDTWFGKKGIGISSKGKIDIHGKQFHYTWTRLASPVRAGDNVIYVQDNVNWEVGQKVVVITSIREDEINNQNEIMTIKAIDGKLIQFENPMSFNHWASSEYQVEVGLLSRRINLKGAEDSEAEKFGGHVMIMGKGRISGVALYAMGQINQLARYPLHFHMMGSSPDSYIRDCSFHHCFYRCLSIHGTHSAFFERNVAYDIFGHCYYIEDGVEVNNTIAYNLAAHIHPIGTPADGGGSQDGVTVTENENLRQPADISAAGFYITNAYNRIIGNSASGGWAGYSFPNLPRPIGLFHNNPNYNDYEPSSVTTLEFDGNTVHSSGYFWTHGACIYIGGLLRLQNNVLVYNSGRNSRETRDKIPGEQYISQSQKLWMKFTNTKAFLCQDGIGHWGERVQIDRYESHDCRRAATVFGEAWVNNAIVTGKTENPATVGSFQQGFQYYDTWVKTILTNIIFRNFKPRVQSTHPQNDNVAIISMTHSDRFKPQGISAARNFTFQNMPKSQQIGHRIQDTGASRYFNFIDWDGKASLRGKPSIVGSHSSWWKLDDNCVFENDWNTWVCDKTTSREIANIDVLIPGVIDNNVYFDSGTDIGKMCLFGSGIVDDRCSIITRNTGITGITANWYMFITNGSPKNFQIQTNQIPFGTSILFAVRYPSNTEFTINVSYRWNNNYNSAVSRVNTLNEVRNGNGKQYYFDGTHLYMKLVNPLYVGSSSEYFERGGVKIFNIMLGYSYSIQTTCSANGEGLCSVSFQLPSIP